VKPGTPTTEAQLFATCLVEEFFPDVLDATVKLLEGLHLKVRPLQALCCGQAPFNEGLRNDALDLARRFLRSCTPGIPVVVPSGSCAAMLKNFYGDLLVGEPALQEKATAIRPWIFELSQFLVNVLKVKYVGARFDGVVAYHPSCHLTRELHVGDEPRLLLSQVKGLRLVSFRNPEECCGFGGMFSVKFPSISTAMAQDKLTRIKESGANTLVSNDCGCLMQLGGLIHRERLPIAVRHVAEVLAGKMN
jgi:L-lactate dehydrogenase complex protein LldE